MKAFAGVACFFILSFNALLAADKATYTFPNGRQAGQNDKVTCQLEIGGELVHLDDGKEHTEKISEVHKLIYHEKTLAAAADKLGDAITARYYEEVDTTKKVGDDVSKLPLRNDRKLIGAVITDQTALLYSPYGPLAQDELVSIDILGNSLLLDRFLPDKPVAIGDSWKHSDNLIGQLLWLDDVGQSDVQSTLKEVTDQVARFKMSGKVLGIIKGTASEIELEANYRYDRRRNRIDWLGMLVKEQRKSSAKSDGANVVARSQTLIIPREPSKELSDAALKNLSFDATPEQLQTQLYAKQGWEITYDRCWNVYHYLQDKAEMHLLERGDIIARCNISLLPKADPAKLVTLEAYQEELRTALEQVQSFGEFVKAGESATPEKCRLLRVEIRGTVSDLPMRWIYYHLADEQGRQAVFVVVVEEKLYDRLAGKDQKLVDAFRFTEPQK
jgi:hypothetical protein